MKPFRKIPFVVCLLSLTSLTASFANHEATAKAAENPQSPAPAKSAAVHQSEHTLEKLQEQKTVMVSERDGWRLDANHAILSKTSDGGKHWKTVHCKPLSEAEAKLKSSGDSDYDVQSFSLDALNANEAWLAIVKNPDMVGSLFLEHTTNDGRDWIRIDTQIHAAGVTICFPDAKHGFLLVCGSPSAGQMTKNLFRTADGGAHWKKIAEKIGGEGVSFYVTGMTFRTAKEGWITGTYHGTPDCPLYQTLDGGKTWKLQTIPIPKIFRQGGYGDTYPPVFRIKGSKDGVLPVNLVNNYSKIQGYPKGMRKTVYFQTHDGGKTWLLPK